MEDQVRLFIQTTILVACYINVVVAENWPSWRGPGNNGISSEVNLPTEWGQEKNIKWRIELPGPAPATPVIWENRIFLTSAKGSDLVLLCFDTQGQELWQKLVGQRRDQYLLKNIS